MKFIKSRISARSIVGLLVVIGVGLAGTYFIYTSHAATSTVTFEAESGTVIKATKVVDTTASGGGAVAFGPTAISGPPWGTKQLYVDPNNNAAQYARANPNTPNVNLIAREGQQPVATWFGSWNSNVQSDANAYVTRASAANAMAVLVAYNIPNRDCGGYSAGGAQTEADYTTWIANLASGIGSRPAIVILEPDAVPLTSCLNNDQLAARWRELSNAVNVLSAHSSTYVYIDAGHPQWVSASDTAARLRSAGIANARGFSLNVSNFTTTLSNLDFGNQVVSLVGNKHYVIDTSRNGNGQALDGQWCNPPGRSLGETPTGSTGNVLADAYLWIKTPWASDGSCNGAPPAGQANWPYAVSLARTAGW